MRSDEVQEDIADLRWIVVRVVQSYGWVKLGEDDGRGGRRRLVEC
jgi:hypothetical protein